MTGQLDKLCEKALDITFSSDEDGIHGYSSMGSTENTYMMTELHKLYSEIMSHTIVHPMDMSEQFHLTPQQLEDFSLPPPHIHTHSIDKVSACIFKEKLKEIIDNPLSRGASRHKKKKLSDRRNKTIPHSLSKDSGMVDHEYIPLSPDNVVSPQTNHHIRPLSAPSSRIHSVSEADDSHYHPVESLPTSPVNHFRSPTSLTTSVSFSSSQQELSDGFSASDPSGESGSIHSNSSSKSRSQSPTSSESGSFFASSLSNLHRGSIPEYGIGNKVGGSHGRRFSTPNSYTESVTRSGTLVRMQKRPSGMHTISIRRKSVVSQSRVARVLKIILAGDDRTVNNMASAYAELKYVICLVCVE